MIDIRSVGLMGITDSDGLVQVVLKVPGIFSLTEPTRFVLDAKMWFEDANHGDYIKSITAEDTDGVIPNELRVMFPYYPILGNWIDIEADVGMKQFYLTPDKATVFSNPQYALRPLLGGIYLICQAQYHSTTANKRFFVTIRWMK